MKRYAIVFLAAIFLPSLVLGWLALRTAGGQRVLIERQAIDLHQAETDVVVNDLRLRIEEGLATFTEAVRSLVARGGPAALAVKYGPELSVVWKGGGVPFTIDPAGRIVYPATALAASDPRLATFLKDNSAFLSNQLQTEIYAQPQAVSKGEVSKERAYAKDLGSSLSQLSRNIMPQKGSAAAPQAESNTSKLAVEVSDFQTAVGSGAHGILSRFVQNELQVLFWTRPDPASNWLFGVMMGPRELDELVLGVLPESPTEGVQLAILNDKARPVVRSPRDFTADWKRPFVATEVGEILPHWEVALYLANPGALTDSARLVSVTLILLIALALAAILAGGYLVAIDTRRQLVMAQKKTDFVSNVSHELKTPLTSIRMFAELLVEGRVEDEEKRNRYLRIIAAESERLTRLVNNVLDFARLERKHESYTVKAMDVHPVIARIWETESLRLREAGFEVKWESDRDSYQVRSDADAVTQIVVNLLSNAEKYHGEIKQILLSTLQHDGQLLIRVCDRGPGVPVGQEEKIFEPFYRVDDSLTAEVSGSGLGLTLARRVARDIGGDLRYQPRESGGSVFTLHLPLSS